PGEPDVADLSGAPGVEHRLLRPTGGEDSVGILEPDHLMVLHQVDAVRLEPAERLVDLARRRVPRPAVDLRHEEDPVAVPVAERFAHPDLARAAVVVPGVV